MSSTQTRFISLDILGEHRVKLWNDVYLSLKWVFSFLMGLLWLMWFTFILQLKGLRVSSQVKIPVLSLMPAALVNAREGAIMLLLPLRSPAGGRTAWERRHLGCRGAGRGRGAPPSVQLLYRLVLMYFLFASSLCPVKQVTWFGVFLLVCAAIARGVCKTEAFSLLSRQRPHTSPVA